jgi:hypothetical protein
MSQAEPELVTPLICFDNTSRVRLDIRQREHSEGASKLVALRSAHYRYCLSEIHAPSSVAIQRFNCLIFTIPASPYTVSPRPSFPHPTSVLYPFVMSATKAREAPLIRPSSMYSLVEKFRQISSTILPPNNHRHLPASYPWRLVLRLLTSFSLARGLFSFSSILRFSTWFCFIIGFLRWAWRWMMGLCVWSSDDLERTDGC